MLCAWSASVLDKAVISFLSVLRSPANSRLASSVSVPLSFSLASIFEIVSSIIFCPGLFGPQGWTLSGPELPILLREQQIKGRHRTIAAGDVLLHLDFLSITEFFVGI